MHSVGSKRFEKQFKKYQEFLDSEFWKEIRTRFYKKKTTIKVCFICGANNNLNLHHRSYKKMKHNTTNNLICLCKNCHYLIHFKDGKRIQAPVKLNEYIKLAVEHYKSSGSYPYHLHSKYQTIINLFLTTPDAATGFSLIK